MATLHKFKLLATQCAVAGSPTRSPTTSPVIHIRRRKTLRMLLSRTADHRRLPHRDCQTEIGESGEDPPEKSNEMVVARHKLKDLFVSSPDRASENRGEVGERLLLEARVSGSVGSSRRGGAGALRPLSAAFRYRLLRRTWRPMLVTIPE